MTTMKDFIELLQHKNIKATDEELWQLPYKNAFIYPRLSSPAQVKESRESVHEIAKLVRLAKQDGYQTSLTPARVDELLSNIQKDVGEKGVVTEGQVTIDFRDLGISARHFSYKGLGLNNLQVQLEQEVTGAVYVSEASRLTRDQTKITPYTLLELMRQHCCRVRTPDYVKNPAITKDWEDLADELEEGIGELKVLARRLNRKRRQKAERGEYVGGPVPPGFIVDIKEREPSGRHIYGKYKRYAPHADICERMLQELIKHNFSKMKAHRALSGLMYPLFPPELKYMERLTALRKATKVEGFGYLISPSMITSLVQTPELVGIWTWGDILLPDNHETAVPVELWLEAYDGIMKRVKPRGRSIHNEPLEWTDLLWFDNDGFLERVGYHSVKGGYRIQREYLQGLGPSVFNISAQYLDIPLISTVLSTIEFTSFAEELLMKLEVDADRSSLLLEERKTTISKLRRRIENLKERLVWEEGKHDPILLEEIEKTQRNINVLQSQTIQPQSVPATSYGVVRDFLIGLPGKWYNYPRSFRNRLLKRLIDRVVLCQKWQIINAALYWKTGQTQTIEIRRPRAKGYRESLWTKEELEILKKLWSNSDQEKILAHLPGRSWKAISHQANNLGLRRSVKSSNHTPRRRNHHEEDRVEPPCEVGVSLNDIDSSVDSSYVKVLKRAREKGWQRQHSEPTRAVTEVLGRNQNPEVSKRITSGIVLGGQVTITVIMYGNLP